MGWLAKLRGVLSTKVAPITLDERRRQPRLTCEFEATCRSEDRDLPALVLDLSSGGLRLRLPKTLEVGRAVRVSCTPQGVHHGRQRLLCRVSWVRPLVTGGAEAGLQFDDTAANREVSWYQPAMRQLATRSVQPRRHRRFATSEAVGVQAEGRSYGVLVDLGMGGARLQLDQALPNGTVLQLELLDENREPLRITGRVVGSQREYGGFSWLSVKFHKLDVDQTALLAARLRGLAAEAQLAA